MVLIRLGMFKTFTTFFQFSFAQNRTSQLFSSILLKMSTYICSKCKFLVVVSTVLRFG